SRARNRSPDPVVSCFFGRIAPSDAATESCFSIRGNRENELQASKASDTETLQSQVNKAAKKRLSLSGLEILHGRLTRRAGLFICVASRPGGVDLIHGNSGAFGRHRRAPRTNAPSSKMRIL